MVRQVLRFTVFPGVFGGSLGATWWGLQEGYSPVLLVFAVTTIAALTVTVMEHVLPYQRAWSKSHGDVPTDLFYGVFSLLAAPRLFEPLILSSLLWLASSSPSVTEIWPTEWPWLIQLATAMVIAELGSYAWHRLMHEWEPLFRLHATHHSVPRLYWLNATRFHPLDNVTMYALHVLPLVVLGVEESVLVGLTVWSLVHGFFQHANIDVRLGPLNYVFSMAELHRWHHSTVPAEANHNYGSNLILWDLVFGTFYWPRQRQPPVNIGLYDLPTFPQRVVPQLLSPFFWPTGRVDSPPPPDSPG